MSKLRHTPGPWDWQVGDRFIRIRDEESVKMGCWSESQKIAETCYSNNSEETISNNLLIAAAPEMLIELLKAIAELDKTGFASVKAETLIMKVTGWTYQELNDILTKLENGISIEEVLSE